MNDVYDALNRLHSPDFFIGMNVQGAPEAPVPAKQIRAFLKTEMDKLDADAIAERWRTGTTSAVPHWHYEYAGWDIDFYPIPKSPELRGKQGVRPIGMRSFEGKFVDSSGPIKAAITKKGGRYGDLDLPYVVAVNTLDESIVDQIDVMNALFGEEQYVITFGPDGPDEHQVSRAPNGVWTSRSGPRYTRISAVLLGVRILPFTVASANLWLIHNPWAQRPYSSVLTCLPQGVPQSGHMEWRPGESLAAILELPEGWPADPTAHQSQ
jgi:hypothetical protein